MWRCQSQLWQPCNSVKCILMFSPCGAKHREGEHNFKRIRFSDLTALAYSTETGNPLSFRVWDFTFRHPRSSFCVTASCMHTHTVKFTPLRYWLLELNHTHKCTKEGTSRGQHRLHKSMNPLPEDTTAASLLPSLLIPNPVSLFKLVRVIIHHISQPLKWTERIPFRMRLPLFFLNLFSYPSLFSSLWGVYCSCPSFCCQFRTKRDTLRTLRGATLYNLITVPYIPFPVHSLSVSSPRAPCMAEHRIHIELNPSKETQQVPLVLLCFIKH